MADLLAIGKSAVAAQHKMLSTTSNNISNVSTSGYVRQRSSTYTNVTGYGVGPTLTQRINNEYQQQEVWRDTSASAYYQTVYNELSPVDQYLSSSSIGMSSSITNLFTSLQSATNNPSSTAERAEAMSSLNDLAVRFNTLYEDVSKAETDNRTKIEEDVQHVNDLLANIAKYNSAILAAKNKEDTETYNLMDQRDAAITELATYIDIRTYPDDDDSNVTLITMASGQSLLLEDGNYAVFDQVAGNPDPSSTQLCYKFVNSQEKGVILNSETIGGELGGLLESREEIKDVKRQLGQLAISMADAFNTQNKEGLDLNGNEGKNLFNIFNSDGSNVITTVSDSSTGGSVKVSYVEGSYDKISTDSFLVKADGSGNNKIYCKDDNGDYTVEVSSTELITNYGLNLTVSGSGSFFIDPTINAASTIDLAVTNSESLALASKYRTSYDTSNSGTGILSISDYSKVNKELNITAVSSTKIQIDGRSFNLQNGDWYCENDGRSLEYEFGLKLEGTISAGDTFSVVSAKGTDVSGDNTNGLLMTAFESGSVIRNSTSSNLQSFAQRYSTLTGTYGSTVNSANTNMTAAEAKLTQSTSSYESTSSVSLDEEAANLVQYQQYYSAAAKIITASQTIFQALINAV